MADTSKAQKLASARKKFKELKREKKKNSSSNQKTSESTEPVLSSREHTPVDNFITNSPVSHENNQQFSNYFQQQPATFFDNFAQNTNNYFNAEPHNSTSTSPSSYFMTPDVNSFINNSNHFDQVDKVVPQVEPVNANVEDNQQIVGSAISLNSSQTENGPEKEEIFASEKQYSSVESLKQLSDEMASLIQPNSEYVYPSHDSSLEIRNRELAELLSQEKVRNEQISVALKESEMKASKLETELRNRDLTSENKVQQEITGLREELQYHIQTVGILVGEKAELSANLSQFQLTAKQKTEECEELQGRLKTSRSRVADLEREIVNLKSEKSQFDSAGREQINELEKLRDDHRNLKLEREEIVQDLLEAREKLKTSSENNLGLQQQINEISSQLSMANIKIQQLTAGDQTSGQIEQLTQEKFALEKTISDLNQTLKTLSKEREESSIQYQQYAQQLNSQLTNLASKLEQLQKENESLTIQEQNRIKHIGELEKQLQSLQNDHVSFATQRTNGEVKAELETSLNVIEKLKMENGDLLDDNARVFSERDALLKELDGKNGTIQQLESLIEELRGNQPDTVKLLAAMESDKVAASRAVSQNADLKVQMESMQEVFMKLNNDKVELTESLTMEQRNNKDLIEKLQKTELHLQTLADAIEIKDKELCHLRDDFEQLNKQVLQSEQLTDRLRHYEAQNHCSHSLQTELQEAQYTIAKLQEELKQSKEIAKDENSTDETENLRQKLVNLEMKNNTLELQLNNVNNTNDPTTLATTEEINKDTNHNDSWTTLDKESAMMHLEKKFLRTMDDIARLTEEKQRLEHLVLQLQGETETIGEYVALYQHQRSILKQRAIEKDQQLTQLEIDREAMKSRLDKLNELIKKLVTEKGAIPSELIQHHELHKEGEGLCEEHARIHSEINKIAENNLQLDRDHCDTTNQSTETAQEIIALLSEIKSSNLVQPTENIHPCPWCSGKLITV